MNLSYARSAFVIDSSRFECDNTPVNPFLLDVVIRVHVDLFFQGLQKVRESGEFTQFAKTNFIVLRIEGNCQ